jgi:hypothetical protein
MPSYSQYLSSFQEEITEMFNRKTQIPLHLRKAALHPNPQPARYSQKNQDCCLQGIEFGSIWRHEIHIQTDADRVLRK